jgi:predicted SnoaL-like aldol condensation-catalyzing enzyme
MMRTLTWMLLALPLATAAPAAAQQPAPFNPYIPNPTPGCRATAAELEANKKVALAFFAPNADRLAITDPTYIQHNPAFIKGAREAKLSDYEYFKSRFGGPAAARGGGAGRQGGAPAGPQPPATQPYEWAMAECDIVFILRKQNRQDPTMAPGNFYEAFTFDAFRIRDGKLAEHWDMAQINPPAAGRGGRGQ